MNSLGALTVWSHVTGGRVTGGRFFCHIARSRYNKRTVPLLHYGSSVWNFSSRNSERSLAPFSRHLSTLQL